MANSSRLSIVTPSAVKFEGDVSIVVAPGAAGDLAALANHAPMLTTLRTGVVSASVASAGADQQTSAGRVLFAVEGGFMQILPDRVIILTDLALSREEVDVEAARSDLKRAEEALAQKRGADDSQERNAVAWAQARLAVCARPV
ncbi:MAG TPA: ATP synthase F1 subunit epsilon [Candidatus Eremiobacteraceae bacterium]|nr:ATP synthase F1 subunit epsilon [Candidatus Eremiobacteraceae bacterium]